MADHITEVTLAPNDIDDEIPDLDRKRKEVSARQQELETLINLGLIIDPSAGFIPLNQLNLTEAKGSIKLEDFKAEFELEDLNEQQEKIKEKLDQIIKNGAEVGIYDKTGRISQSSYPLANLLPVEDKFVKTNPKVGSFIMISTSPVGTSESIKPVAFRVIGQGIVEYIPWKETARFLSAGDADVLEDVVARVSNTDHPLAPSVGGDTVLDSK